MRRAIIFKNNNITVIEFVVMHTKFEINERFFFDKAVPVFFLVRIAPWVLHVILVLLSIYGSALQSQHQDHLREKIYRKVRENSWKRSTTNEKNILIGLPAALLSACASERDGEITERICASKSATISIRFFSSSNCSFSCKDSELLKTQQR